LADAQSKRITPNVHVGTMGWSYDFWKGNFYPQKLASKDFLSYFATQFGSVEVDSTFYRIPNTKTVTDWKNQTPKDFVFSLKFPQVITHVRMLKDCQDVAKVFLESASLLGEKLGVLLLQFPPMFRQQHAPLLKDFIGFLPKRHRYAVEVRNTSLLNTEIYQLLRDNNVALAWVDSSSMPLIEEITADFLYLRWEGDRKTVNGTLGKTETDRIKNIQEWANRLRPLLNKGTKFFGYFSKYYSGFPPSDVNEFLKQIKIR
jgi:uncharacterized protein YecE (DUF72 family)